MAVQLVGGKIATEERPPKRSRPDAALFEDGADAVEGYGVGGFTARAGKALAFGFDAVGCFPQVAAQLVVDLGESPTLVA